MTSLGFHRSPDVLRPLTALRDTRNRYRKIADELIPQLMEFERLIPDIFDLDSVAGAENRRILIEALTAGDKDSLELLIKSYEPYYQAQLQLEAERKMKERKRVSASDLPRR